MVLYKFKKEHVKKDTQTVHKKKENRGMTIRKKRIQNPLDLLNKLDLEYDFVFRFLLSVFGFIIIVLCFGPIFRFCLSGIQETQETDTVKEERPIEEETNRVSSYDLPKQLNVTVDKENPTVDFVKLCPDLTLIRTWSNYYDIVVDVYLDDEHIVKDLSVFKDNAWNAYERCNDEETKTYNLTVYFSGSTLFDTSEIGTVPLTLTVKR